jgi:transcriptional regulator with XRE-family HTH domain
MPSATKTPAPNAPPEFDPVQLNAIRVLRQARGWSQSGLAWRVDALSGQHGRCSRQHVSMWERGESVPGPKYLPAIAAVFEVDPVRLVSWLAQFQPSK